MEADIKAQLDAARHRVHRDGAARRRAARARRALRHAHADRVGHRRRVERHGLPAVQHPPRQSRPAEARRDHHAPAAAGPGDRIRPWTTIRAPCTGARSATACGCGWRSCSRSSGWRIESSRWRQRFCRTVLIRRSRRAASRWPAPARTGHRGQRRHQVARRQRRRQALLDPADQRRPALEILERLGMGQFVDAEPLLDGVHVVLAVAQDADHRDVQRLQEPHEAPVGDACSRARGWRSRRAGPCAG